MWNTRSFTMSEKVDFKEACSYCGFIERDSRTRKSLTNIWDGLPV